MRNHNELEIHVFNPGKIEIPDREASWGLPIYVRPIEYLRNRQKWEDEREADRFFGANGVYERADAAQRVSIEINYDITRARAALALSRTLAAEGIVSGSGGDACTGGPS